MRKIIFLLLISICGCATTDTSTIYMLDQRIKIIERDTEDYRNKIKELESKVNGIQIPNHTTHINTLYKRVEKVEKSFQSCVQDYVSLKSKVIPPLYEEVDKVTRDTWIKLKNGAKKKITFKLIDNQWVGPKGEYYNSFPTEKEIKLIYYE